MLRIEDWANLFNLKNQESAGDEWSRGFSSIIASLPEKMDSTVEMLEKLAAAVPPPRGHLVRYIGALAPHSKIRSQVVPVPKPRARDDQGKLKSSATARATWAELMKRTFGFDLTRCIACGGKVKAIAVIANPILATEILQRIAGPPPSVLEGQPHICAPDISIDSSTR